MTTLRLGQPYWLARAPAPPTLPRLTTRLDAEVAIVGGGLTGCAAALACVEAGIEAVVLEGHEIGRGSTAASTALLMQEPDRDFHELVDRYGSPVARRIWGCSHQATVALAATLHRLRIRCDLQPRDSVYYATNARGVDRLRHEYRDRQRARIDSEWLDTDAVERIAGFRSPGAIFTRGNFEADPYRACVGLARAAASRGAPIFERSPVIRIETNRSHVDVITRSGRVRASRVIIATGYATREFAALHARFKLYTTYVIATPLLSRATRAAIGLSPLMLWDTERPYHYLRWTPDHRLMVGGDDERRLPVPARKRLVGWHTERLRQYIGARYPALAHVRPAFAWEGLFAMTPDGLPYVGPHRRYPRHLFALGYGGNGMTFGFLASQMLVRFHQGRDTADDRLFSFARTSL
jgi:glycine/D-amino acid oxidase-like deaminating enzyme